MRRLSTPLGAATIGLVALLSGASTNGAQDIPQKSVTMQDLTVPNDRLPSGCGLKVIAPPSHEVIAAPPGGTIRVTKPTPSMHPGGLNAVTANPWTGTDRRILAELRQRVDGYGQVRLPDGPPLTGREQSAMLLKFADGVEEGYAATYTQSGGRDLGGWAVRFAAPSDDRSDLPNRYNIGSIRAALFGDGGVCSTAIERHLNSLRK